MWLQFLIVTASIVTCPATLQTAGDGTVTVQTKEGTLRGRTITSYWGRPYYAFQNIPYAQPPVGDLRFKSPKPVKKWVGVRDAQQQGSYCPQEKITYTNSSMSEDCLYLNVFIPKLAGSQTNKLLTVMAWIHDGAFVMHSGIRDDRGPDHSMNLTSILVTLNYRLGAFGFLSLEHPDVTTNAGMKDQLAALRWIQRNIAFFGGNPKDVTLFGESAGAMSVDLHLLSPLSRGLFHRTIAQSGSSLLYRTDFNGTRGAFRLAEVLGHNTTSRDDLVRFLRSVDVDDLVTAQSQAATEADGTTAAFRTNPMVEPKVQEGNEVFLSDTPENLWRAGKVACIPSIVGVNLLETRESDVTDENLERYFNDPEYVVPSFLNLKKGSEESMTLASKLRNFYFGSEPISYATIRQLFDLISDRIIYATYKAAQFRLEQTSAPIYMYYFVYNGTLRLRQNKRIVAIGPGHADDVPYLFTIKYVPYNPTSDDVLMINRMTNMWVDFAETGDPSRRQSVKWVPTSLENHEYLKIDVELRLLDNFLKKRMNFWDEIYSMFRHRA